MPEARQALADELVAGGGTARLTRRESAIHRYAEKLTRAPAALRREDVQSLREAGLTDREIHDVAQAAAYFAYVNRIALGLGARLGADEGPAGQWPASPAGGV